LKWKWKREWVWGETGDTDYDGYPKYFTLMAVTRITKKKKKKIYPKSILNESPSV